MYCTIGHLLVLGSRYCLQLEQPGDQAPGDGTEHRRAGTVARVSVLSQLHLEPGRACRGAQSCEPEQQREEKRSTSKEGERRKGAHQRRGRGEKEHIKGGGEEKRSTSKEGERRKGAHQRRGRGEKEHIKGGGEEKRSTSKEGEKRKGAHQRRGRGEKELIYLKYRTAGNIGENYIWRFGKKKTRD